MPFRILYLFHSKRMAYRQFTCFIICFYIITTRLLAQDSLFKMAMPIYTHTSLFYDFPQSFGATAGVELPINSRHIVISKKGKHKEKYKNLVALSDVGFYRYRYNNTGLFLLQSVGFRRYKAKPYYFEWLATVGILRTFYDGIVYSVSDAGVVTTLPHFGRLYAITGLTTVFGFDFERSSKPKPLTVSIQPSLWIQYPYNSFVLPHLSLQLCFNYHFHRFNISVHQKQINRTRS